MKVPWSTIAATAAATAPWLLAVLVVYLRRRPAEPEPGPPTLDLGDEPPAIANLLVHDFRVTRDAVPATLLDLAARRLVEIEEREPGSYVCRLEERSDGELTSYERRVLELLRSRASNGVVPTEALTTGPKKESSRWWKGFEKEVVSDAQQRGLCLDILDKRTFLWLSAAAAAPATALGVLAGGRAGFGYWVVAFFFLGWVMGLHTQRETPEGLAAASRWLGVRAKLAEDEAFQSQAPIAVALWERHLAYGAAVALATVVLVAAGLVALWARADLGSTREVTGQILRLRAYGDDDDKRFYVAVDDGTSATIRAWRVKSDLYSPLRQYEIVT